MKKFFAVLMAAMVMSFTAVSVSAVDSPILDPTSPSVDPGYNAPTGPTEPGSDVPTEPGSDVPTEPSATTPTGATTATGSTTATSKSGGSTQTSPKTGTSGAYAIFAALAVLASGGVAVVAKRKLSK